MCKMNVLSMDELRLVLTDLEKIEMQAIRIMGSIRDPRFSTDSQKVFNTLLEIQIRIRDFRGVLSKNDGDFDSSQYHDFVIFASSALHQCTSSHVYHSVGY